MPSPETMRCLGCGYDLRGLPENRCPECGRAFDPSDRATFVCCPDSGLAELAWAVAGIGVLMLGAVGVASGAGIRPLRWGHLVAGLICVPASWLISANSLSRCVTFLRRPTTVTVQRYAVWLAIVIDGLSLSTLCSLLVVILMKVARMLSWL